MASQTVLWTALPNRYSKDGASLRVSVLASPRLEPAGSPAKLQTFPRFLDWPATLARSSFTISYSAGGSVTIPGDLLDGSNRVDTGLAAADSDTWKALFPPATYVRGFEFRDLSNSAVLSYDTTAIETLARELYTDLARKATDALPKVSDLVDDPGWGRLIDAVAENDRRFVNQKTGLRDPARQFRAVRDSTHHGEPSLAEHLARFQLFHTPASKPRPVERTRKDDPRITARYLEYDRTKLPAASDFAKQLDFHQIVAAMNQYPTLLRRLGLVVDLVLDARTFAPSPDALLSVTVELPPPDDPPTRPGNPSPRTHTVLSPTRFEPVPRTAPEPGDYRTADGLLRIEPNDFRLIQADVDGVGHKLVGFARSLGRLRAGEERLDPTTRFEREVGAPSIRNAGLMLVHRGRGAMLENAFARNKQRDDALKQIHANAPVPAPELFAEDLVRGYRIDIWDRRTRVWRSLCQRVADYELDDGATTFTVEREEGTVRLAATRSPDPASNPDVVYLHEALTSWTGWSLCAPQPGKAIDPGDGVGAAEPEVPPGMRLRTRFRALGGSLPRLRYGRRYWVRARVVDLAGNSLEPQQKDFGPESPEDNSVLYLRYDPIAAPVGALVRRADGKPEPPLEGESMQRIAIRSLNVTPADNTIPTTATARRFAVPARTTVREAEQHGMLDAAGRVDPGTFGLLKGQDRPLKQVELAASGPLATPGASKTTFAVLREGAPLPYLPDPFAGEIAARIFDLPGWNDADVIRIPLYPDGLEWPRAEPFTIELVEEAAGSPRFDELARALLIPLPKGERAQLRLSVAPSARALAQLGVWNWLAEDDRKKLERLARSGQHWLLTPWRTFELVHAVQKPLLAPELELRISRFLGETSARPMFDASVSLKSTDRVDLQAEWNEPADDLDAGEGANRLRADTAFAVKITDEGSYAMRTVDPKFTGLPDHLILGPDRIRAGGVQHDHVQPKVHEFHDTRYRRIEYWLEATTRFREYMTAGVLTKKVDGDRIATDENIKVVGPRAVEWIPSSAPPPAPEVLYTVPTFGWVRTGDEGQGRQSSWRRGAGLRVYLDGPWNVSGYGEMLAVVLVPGSFRGDPDTDPVSGPLKNFVTQWANDPIWSSPYVRGIGPRRSDFPLARTTPDPAGSWLPDFAPGTEADQRPGEFAVTGRPHPALTGSEGRVDVAPHDVFYDAKRGLWYCDIELAAGSSYFPFVRLALARYQPDSVYGAHLSNIALADFMSLAPDRWLNVTRTKDPRVRRVGVFGHTYEESAGHEEAASAKSYSLRLLESTLTIEPPFVAPSSIVEVWVERLEPALGEDFGWQREPRAAAVRDDRLAGRRVSKTSARIVRERKRAQDLVGRRDFETLARADLIGRVRVTPTLWEGTVNLPADAPPGTRHRLVVTEYEEYLVDGPLPIFDVPSAKDRRIVFVEHVELD